MLRIIIVFIAIATTRNLVFNAEAALTYRYRPLGGELKFVGQGQPVQVKKSRDGV